MNKERLKKLFWGVTMDSDIERSKELFWKFLQILTLIGVMFIMAKAVFEI
jgi:hypothetical protein